MSYFRRSARIKRKREVDKNRHEMDFALAGQKYYKPQTPYGKQLAYDRTHSKPRSKNEQLRLTFAQQKKRQKPTPKKSLSKTVRTKRIMAYKKRQRRTRSRRTRSRRGRRTKRSKRRFASRSRSVPSSFKKYVNMRLSKPLTSYIKERKITPLQYSASSNQCNYETYTINRWNNLDTVLADAFRTLNDSGGIQTIDVTANNTNRKIHFKPSKLKAHFRNNSSQPVKLHFWWCRFKKDMEINPENALISAFDDISGGDGGYETSLMWWPQNCPTWLKCYKISNHRSIMLNPGHEYHLKRYSDPFVFDSEEWNNDTSQIYKRRGSAFLLTRIEGTIAHDQTDPTLIGTNACTVDAIFQVDYTFNMRDAPAARRIFQQVSTLDPLPDPIVFMEGDPAEEKLDN